MRTRITGVSVICVTIVLVAVLASGACGGKNSPNPVNPAAPTAAATSASAATSPTAAGPAAAAITCSTKLSQPADTCQLTMMVTFSDGSTRDVTANASWGYGGAVSVSPSGLVTARSYGMGEIIHNAYREVQPNPMLVRVLPDDSFIITGRVAEGGVKVQEARVSARSASGTATTTSSGDGGSYELAPVSGDAVIRVEKEGYIAQERKVNVHGDGVADFDLARSGAPAGIEGVYTLAFAAAPSCALPAEFMRRTYQARITETAEGLLVVLGGPGFEGDWYLYGFRGKRDGSAVRFDVHGTPGDPVADYDYIFTESLDGWCTMLNPCRTEHRYLSFQGTAAGSIGERSIPTVFSGMVLLYTGTRTLVQCNGDHRLEFVR
jgi:hypothetical protein